MNKSTARIPLLLIAFLYAGCSRDNSSTHDQEYFLGGVGAFSEMVQAGVKKLAISAPLSPMDMDRVMADAQRIAAEHHVEIFRESELLVTDLFADSVTKGKDVLLIYKGTTKDEYLRLKSEATKLQNAGQYHGAARTELSRRFGKMLSYPNARINELLAQQSPLRTMNHFGIRATNVFLYYRNLAKAADFYSKTLGMEQVADYGMARIFRVTSDSYLILVDASKGMHSADEPKTVAIALITDQLEAWYDYLKTTNTKIKYDFKLKPNRPHDGFVIEDSEGYLLEFERFNDHPENDNFVPVLNTMATVLCGPSVPKGLGFKATVTWLYYKDMVNMEKFYQETLGLSLVADQGWAKIYSASTTGYMGLVDERRGMHSFTEKKAVNVSFILDDLDGWFGYVKDNGVFALRDTAVSTGPEKKYRAFVWYDPEGYYMEFDTFYEHADNKRLMDALQKK